MKDLEKKPLSVSFEQLAENILAVDHSLYGFTVKAINQAATIRNWIIGGYIVEYEQHGEDRAQYGEQLIETLAKRIHKTGLGATLLRKSRAFYSSYPAMQQLFTIRQTASVELHQQLQRFLPIVNHRNCHALSTTKFCTPAEILISKLSFSHIVETPS